MRKLTVVLFLAFWPFYLLGQEVSVPDGFQAIDKPNDNGQGVILIWKKMSFETDDVTYTPMVAESANGEFYRMDEVPAILNFKSDLPAVFGYDKENADWHAIEVQGFSKMVDGKNQNVFFEPNHTYFFKIAVRLGKNGGDIVSTGEVSTTPVGNLFARQKTNNFLIFIFLLITILTFIHIAKRNSNLFIRKIAGLDAIDDALGRATEMGRSVLFVHGLKSVYEVSTIAAINILGRIAKRVAEFDSQLKVANWDPVIQQVSQETVKESYIEAGRPDAYKEENVYFASSEQFSYAAAIEGLMMREKPAANFYFGYFYAESLLLSETGNAAGSIQIAGTDAFTQIPFFITTCDYTLIGEELYAASAYLSREPKLLGSLKGQDMGKLVLIIILILGTLFTTFGWQGLARMFTSL